MHASSVALCVDDAHSPSTQPPVEQAIGFSLILETDLTRHFVKGLPGGVCPESESKEYPWTNKKEKG